MQRFFKLLLTFLILPVLTITAYSAPQPYPSQGRQTFKGLDTKSSPTEIADGRAKDILNCKFTIAGALKKREGKSLIYYLDDIYGAISPITGLYYVEFSDGTTHIITIEGDQFFDNGSVVSRWGVPTITAGKNNQFVFVTALDSVIASNDVDVPIKYNGTTISTLDLTDLSTDAPTKVKCLAWFQNFLILGNTVENGVEKPTRIRWSNIGTIETWTEADRNDISELGGQEITAFSQLYDDLYIFLTDSVWKMSFVGGNEQFKFTKVLSGIGCISKNGVQNVILANSQRGLIFPTRDSKFYFFNGVTASYISEIIEPTVEALNTSRLQYAVSVENGIEYFLSVSSSSSTTNDQIFSFNYRIGEWSILDDIDANSLSKIIDSNEKVQIYSGNYASCVYKLETTDQDYDVDTGSGTITAKDFIDTETVSAARVIYDSSKDWTTDSNDTVTGAIVKLREGATDEEEKIIIGYTETGIIVDSDFSSASIGDTFTFGAIDAYYESKDYDCGISNRKDWSDLFMWVKEQGNESLTFTYKNDFGGITDTQTVEQQESGSTWGEGIWGEAVWGGFPAVLKEVPLTGQSRFLSFKIDESDANESFFIYSFNLVFTPRNLK